MAKIRQSNIDKSIITAQTELASSGADDDMLLIYDTSAGLLKKIKRFLFTLKVASFVPNIHIILYSRVVVKLVS